MRTNWNKFIFRSNLFSCNVKDLKSHELLQITDKIKNTNKLN